MKKKRELEKNEEKSQDNQMEIQSRQYANIFKEF